jgi:hypothetical protein
MEEAWEAESERDECIVNLTGPERDYWSGIEAGMLKCYWFSKAVFGRSQHIHCKDLGFVLCISCELCSARFICAPIESHDDCHLFPLSP